LKWKKKSDATVAGSENGASAVVAEIAREAMRKPKGSEVSDTLLLGMAQGRDALAEKLAGLTAQPSAADPIAALSSAVDLLKKLQPGDGRAAAVDALAALDRAAEILKKLQPQPAPAQARSEPEDPLTYVDRVLNLADRLRPAASAVATGDGGSLQSVGVIVHEVATLVKDPLIIAMRMWADSKARSAAGAPATVARTQHQPAPAPQPEPAPAQVAISRRQYAVERHAGRSAAATDRLGFPNNAPDAQVAYSAEVGHRFR